MINDIIIANEIKINIFHGIVFCLISKCSFLSQVGSDKELTTKVSKVQVAEYPIYFII